MLLPIGEWIQIWLVGGATTGDEGMTNRPLIFAYLVFGPGGITIERIARPTKTAAWHGPGAKLGVQAKIQRVRARLSFG
jgi:hypothetical protein